MTLQELSTKLQNLCHDGHSLDEVYIDTDGENASKEFKERAFNLLVGDNI